MSAKDGGRTVTIGGHAIELSNLDKPLFPKSGLTKGDLIDYYGKVAETALPHLRDRPVTLQRFPDGIGAGGFFQKDAPDYFPEWIERARLEKEGGTVDHVLVNNAATLVYLANQACITPHVGLSRIDRIERPDRLVIDLDPSSDDFGGIQEAAARVRQVLEEVGLAAFVQTTGSRGLHVVAPLDRSADFDATRDFARALCSGLARRFPDAFTVEQRKDKRGNRIYLDYLRNAYGQTFVAPYAVRALEEAPVATPLDWSEAGSKNLTPRKYTIKTLFRRLAQRADPWREMDRRRRSLQAAQRRLDAVIEGL